MVIIWDEFGVGVDENNSHLVVWVLLRGDVIFLYNFLWSF